MTVDKLIGFILKNTKFSDLAKFYDPTTDTNFYYDTKRVITEIPLESIYAIPLHSDSFLPGTFTDLYYNLSKLPNKYNNIHFWCKYGWYKPHIIT
jgi:hypothetical protein